MTPLDVESINNRSPEITLTASLFLLTWHQIFMLARPMLCSPSQVRVNLIMDVIRLRPGLSLRDSLIEKSVAKGSLTRYTNFVDAHGDYKRDRFNSLSMYASNQWMLNFDDYLWIIDIKIRFSAELFSRLKNTSARERREKKNLFPLWNVCFYPNARMPPPPCKLVDSFC